MSGRREFLFQSIAGVITVKQVAGALGRQTLTGPKKVSPGDCLLLTGNGTLKEVPCVPLCVEGESRCPVCCQCQLPLPLIEQPVEWGEDSDDEQAFFATLATWIKARVCSKCKSVYVP